MTNYVCMFVFLSHLIGFTFLSSDGQNEIGHISRPLYLPHLIREMY